MPLKDDFIQRSIEQLAEVIRALLRVQSPLTLQQAERAIAEAYEKHAASSASLFRQLPTDQLLAIISSVGQVDKEKAYLFASLFYAEAELQKVKGEEVSTALQLKALDLFLEAAIDDVDAEDVHERIADLRHKLSDFILPEATDWRLFDYAQYSGKFAEAETCLFEMIDQYGITDALQTKGNAFYKRLLAMKDTELEQGGLPRDEVEEGRLEFEDALIDA
ncbi:MAG: hypothetical protein KC422_11205 [Trueperaceae bacterium]|nr:hypothetical protein [Trueperaceae bacterium]